MENNEVRVKIVTNKTYFIEDTINISFKFNNKVNIYILLYLASLILIKHLKIYLFFIFDD